MNFPDEWESLSMIPEKGYMSELIESYRPGMEQASEHDRNGCFHYWLRKNPSEEILVNLAKLSIVEPERGVADDIQSYIRRAENYTPRVEETLNDL